MKNYRFVFFSNFIIIFLFLFTVLLLVKSFCYSWNKTEMNTMCFIRQDDMYYSMCLKYIQGKERKKNTINFPSWEETWKKTRSAVWFLICFVFKWMVLGDCARSLWWNYFLSGFRFNTSGPKLSPHSLLCTPWLPSQYGH